MIGTLLQYLSWKISIVTNKLWLIINIIITIYLKLCLPIYILSDPYNIMLITIKNDKNSP